MGMELLTATDTDKLHVGASGILSNAQALEDQFKRLDGLILSLFPGWEGEASDSLYFLWRDFYNAMHETWGTIRHAGYGMSRLANELELAQFEYRKWVAAAEAAGFTIGADGMISELPPVAPDADIRTLAQRADDYRMYAHRIEGALEEAEAADRRAAEIFERELRDQTENPALAQFLETYAEKAEPLYSALGGSLATTAAGLERYAARPGISAAERARALATAQRYRALANNPVFRAANTKVFRRFPVMGVASIPLGYVQYRAEGDDGGLAATKATVSGTSALAFGGAAAMAATAAAAAVVSAPAAVAAGIVAGIIGSSVGQAVGDAVGPWVHRNVVTPYIGPIATPLMEDIQEFGDDLRQDWRWATEDLGHHANNFPRDFRDAMMGDS